MTKDIVQYKGYYARVQYDCKERVLYGKIEGIDDLVTFESDSAKTIDRSFREAVDDYLRTCKSIGKSPERLFSGVFNVRISPELHKALTARAFQDGDKLNGAVEKAIRLYLAS
ncbi:MAG: type II toxin-antitoxin system HicB family antitoxin [Lachnospiraceae bacterium]|nr:type II toxin-antitoxin system HicB family antitoxin [Lachnospiraceae bacterium]